MISHLDAYINLITSRHLPKLAESIRRTADDFEANYLSSFDFQSTITGLLMGNVQSGKTGQMFGIICKAADYGFPAFLILTTDSNVLYDQTLNRVRDDLPDFCVCGENDGIIFEKNNLVKNVIVVLKKNHRILKLWADIFKTSEQMQGNPLFILDDEADASSLNTLINSGEQSSINKYISAIKDDAFCCIYLQVTGTPQALFLQAEVTGFHPSFVYYFKPGDGYIGGDFFFPEKGAVPDCIALISGSNDDKEFDEFIVRHLLVSALINLNGGDVSNALIHPSARTSEHEKLKNRTDERLDFFKHHSDEFKRLAGTLFLQFDPQKTQIKSFIKVYETALDILLHKIHVIVLNSKNETSPDLYAFGYNIVIGGNTLGRGVTFPALNTIYYTRTSKRPQADTIWQHSRMFGYDRDPGLIKVFISPLLFKLFRDINAANNAIIEQVSNGCSDISIYYHNGIKPTRDNVLDKHTLNMLIGGTNYFPLDPENDDIAELDSLLADYDDKEEFYTVPIAFGIKVLSRIESRGADFDVSFFINALTQLQKKNNDLILIVRRNRALTKGTGAMLSSNDYALTKKFVAQPVLILYKVTGDKGWHNRQIWIPNIKLPSNGVYYKNACLF